MTGVFRSSAPDRTLHPRNSAGLTPEQLRGRNTLQPMHPPESPIGWRVKTALVVFWLALGAAMVWRLG